MHAGCAPWHRAKIRLSVYRVQPGPILRRFPFVDGSASWPSRCSDPPAQDLLAAAAVWPASVSHRDIDQCSAPSSSAPILFRLSLHRGCVRVLHLETTATKRHCSPAAACRSFAGWALANGHDLPDRRAGIVHLAPIHRFPAGLEFLGLDIGTVTTNSPPTRRMVKVVIARLPLKPAEEVNHKPNNATPKPPPWLAREGPQRTLLRD
jgi:hypothetical protein